MTRTAPAPEPGGRRREGGVGPCYDRAMFGRARDWVSWLAVAVTAILLVRLGLWLALPGLPQPFAWSGSLMLGLALVFLLRPLPHEALLAHRPVREPGPDRLSEP